MPASRPDAAAGARQPRVLVVGCGALARELVALTRDLPNVDITCLPATLHNRPGGIPAAVRERIRRRRAGYDRVFVAYADCGTGGLLDPVIAEEGVERLAGAHCYEFYATSPEFARLVEDEPGDVLPDRFPGPQLRPAGHQGSRARPASRSCVTSTSATTSGSSTSPRPTIRPWTRPRAARPGDSGLRYEQRSTGYGQLATTIAAVAAGGPAPPVISLLESEVADRMGTMTVIWWRDIPAQVTAREGRRQSKIVLHPRFQVAIDKAASRAGKRAYNDYIEEWRRTQTALRRRHRRGGRGRGRASRGATTTSTAWRCSSSPVASTAAPVFAPAHDETQGKAVDA